MQSALASPALASSALASPPHSGQMTPILASPTHSGQITPNDNVDKIFLPKKFKSQITPTLKSQGAGDYSLAGNGLGLGAGGKEKFFLWLFSDYDAGNYAGKAETSGCAYSCNGWPYKPCWVGLSSL